MRCALDSMSGHRALQCTEGCMKRFSHGYVGAHSSRLNGSTRREIARAGWLTAARRISFRKRLEELRRSLDELRPTDADVRPSRRRSNRMIQRRAFVAGMAAMMAAGSSRDAQSLSATYRLGILAEGSAVADITGPSPRASTIRELLGRLRELGYRYGDNLWTEVRSAEGRIDRFQQIAMDLAQAKPSAVVVTSNRAAMAMKEATNSIPIVMAGISDPIGFNLVPMLSKPGGNLTGIALDTGPEFAAKRLELLKELSPSVRRVAYFIPTLVWLERPGGKAIQEAASALGMTLLPIVVTTREELDAAAAAIRSPRADALLVEAYVFSWVERRRFSEFALSNRIPAMFGNREIVEAGGLLSYTTDFNTVYRRAAEYVDTIFKGAKPGDLPIEQPSRFQFAVNLKTAKSLGIAIPQSLLVRADEVIQ